MKAVTVRGAFLRLAVGVLVGAFVGVGAMYWWMEARPPSSSPWVFDRFDMRIHGVFAGFFGMFFGAVGGWVWLVLAVGREARARVDAADRTSGGR